MNGHNPAFVMAAYAQASHPEKPIDIQAFVASAKVYAADLMTDELSDSDRIAIDLWAHLANRQIFVYDFRQRGQFWEALLPAAPGEPAVWRRVVDLLRFTRWEPPLKASHDRDVHRDAHVVFHLAQDAM